MNKKSKIRILILMAFLLISVISMNFSNTLPILSPASFAENYNEPVTIDLITIQSLVRAISTTEIPVMSYVQTIDSLNKTWNISQIRNPFVKKARSIKKPEKKRKSATRKKIKKGRPTIIVNGIVWDESNPYAILNGEIYGVEDKISGYTIRAITDTLVILYNSKDLYTIKLNQE